MLICYYVLKNVDEYLKYSFYLYVFLSFKYFYDINKCFNALNVHLYD